MGATTGLVSILLVGQAENCREIKAALGQSGLEHEVIEATGCGQAKALLAGGNVTVILCERDLADGTWHTVLEHALEAGSKPSLIVCYRHADERLWAEVLNLGAHDLLLSEPVVPDELVRVVESAHRACPHLLAKAAG
jgi:DNA-binding NtrC family response regulator